MRCVVIFYHRDIHKIYLPKWIDSCIDSVKNQTLQEFDVIELNYGESSYQLCSDIRPNYHYIHQPFPNHIMAMNFIINEAFSMGYDVIFNTNMDDKYDISRFEIQLQKIKEGHQLISSNFYYINCDDTHTNTLNMTGCGDIGKNLAKRHNVIAHPVVAIHRSFWTGLGGYKTLLGYEDLDLWQRAYSAGRKFYICEEYLLHYRIHPKQVTQSFDASGKRK